MWWPVLPFSLLRWYFETYLLFCSILKDVFCMMLRFTKRLNYNAEAIINLFIINVTPNSELSLISQLSLPLLV